MADFLDQFGADVFGTEGDEGDGPDLLMDVYGAAKDAVGLPAQDQQAKMEQDHVAQGEERKRLVDYLFPPLEFAKDTGAAALTFANSALFGAPEALGDLAIKGANLIGADIPEGSGIYDAAREEMGAGPALVAEIGGGVMTGGSVGKLAMEKGLPVAGAIGDRLIDAIRGTQNARLFPRAVRAVEQGVGTAAETALYQGVTNPEEYVDNPLGVAGNVATGFAGGTAMQGVLGELAPLLSKWTSRDWKKSEIMSRLLDEGAQSSIEMGSNNANLITPTTLRNAVNEATPEQGLLNLNNREVNQTEMLTRFMENMSDIEYHNYNQGAGLSKGPVSREQDLVKSAEIVDSVYKDINADITNGWQSIIGNPDTPRKSYEATQTALAPLKAEYEGLYRTDLKGPDGRPKAGARPVNYENLISGVEDTLKKDLKLGEITDLDSDMMSVWNEAKTLLRGKIQDPHGRGVHAPRVQRDGMEGGPIGSIKLADVNNAIKELNKMRDPRFKAGTQYDKSKAKAATSVIKHLQDVIADRTFGKSDRVRAEYAAYLKSADEYEFGREVFSGKLENPDNGMNIKEHLAQLPKGEKQAFSEGYTYELGQRIGQNGFYNTMHAVVGAPGDIPAVFSAMRTNQAKVELLREALGTEQANKLIDLYVNGGHREQAAAKLAMMVGAKKNNPAAIGSLVREGDGLLLSDAFRPGQSSMLANATLGALGRQMKRRTPVSGELTTDLMTAKGGDLRSMIEDYLRAYQRPTSVKAGPGAGLAFTTPTEEDEGSTWDRIMNSFGAN